MLRDLIGMVTFALVVIILCVTISDALESQEEYFEQPCVKVSCGCHNYTR